MRDYSVSYLISGAVYRYSGFYIMLKNTNVEAIFEQLNAIGMKDITRLDAPSDREEEFEFALLRTPYWTIICDNLYYSLLNNNYKFSILRKLGQQTDLFYYWVGDIDYAYGFGYYENGEIIRDRYVSNRSMVEGDVKVERDFGPPFPNEEEYLQRAGENEKLLPIANGLGIFFPETNDDIEIYAYRLGEKPSS